MKYILVAIESNKNESVLKSLVVDYNKEDSGLPKVLDKFSTSFNEQEPRSIERAYFSFEDFTFKHQRAIMASWGDFAFKKIKDMSIVANSDFSMSFKDKDFVDLMTSFSSHMKLNKPATFKKAYENIAGRHMIGDKSETFFLLNNISIFLGNALGDKFTKKHHNQGSKRFQPRKKTSAKIEQKKPKITIKKKV